MVSFTLQGALPRERISVTYWTSDWVGSTGGGENSTPVKKAVPVAQPIHLLIGVFRHNNTPITRKTSVDYFVEGFENRP